MFADRRMRRQVIVNSRTKGERRGREALVTSPPVKHSVIASFINFFFDLEFHLLFLFQTFDPPLSIFLFDVSGPRPD